MITLKIGVFILLVGSVYQQLFKERDLIALIDQVKDSWANSSVLYFFLAFLLMPLNWYLESYKWKMLVSKVEKISLLKSIRAVLAGVTFTMFTPNRIGEYGGRFLFLKAPWNPNIWLATFTGSYAQIIVTLGAGVGAAFILFEYLMELIGKDLLLHSVLNSLTALTLILLFFYFNSGWAINLMNKSLFRKIFKKYRQADLRFSFLILLKSILLSAMRYGVYATQYYLLLKFFSIPIGFIDGLLFISLIYLVQTLIPSVAILELGIRSNIALFLLIDYSGKEPEILAATFILWLINLLIPAFLGYLAILFKRRELVKTSVSHHPKH